MSKLFKAMAAFGSVHDVDFNSFAGENELEFEDYVTGKVYSVLGPLRTTYKGIKRLIVQIMICLLRSI